MVNISRRRFLKGLIGLVGTAVLGTLIFRYIINNSSYQNFPNNLNNLQYIFWDVPWGPGNGTYKLLDPYFQSNSTILIEFPIST